MSCPTGLSLQGSRVDRSGGHQRVVHLGISHLAGVRVGGRAQRRTRDGLTFLSTSPK